MKNEMLNIYTAKKSKSGKYINVTLIQGEQDKRKYYTTCVELDNDKKNVQAKIKGDYVFIKIKVSHDDNKEQF